MIRLLELTVKYGPENHRLEAFEAHFAQLPPEVWVELQLLDLDRQEIHELLVGMSDPLGEISFKVLQITASELTRHTSIALRLVSPVHPGADTVVYFSRIPLATGWDYVRWHLNPWHWRYYFKDALWVNYRQADWS